MEEITTSCRRESTRYTRLNLLGWALVCPNALELLKSGYTPPLVNYPTAEESDRQHKRLMRQVSLIAGKILDPKILHEEKESWQEIGFKFRDFQLCARSKADLVYTLNLDGRLVTLYIEVSSRVFEAKKWQAILRGLALYYERNLPVLIALVTPDVAGFKLLTERDQWKLRRMILGRIKEDFVPSPELCSLCELSSLCPFKVV